MGSDPHHKGRTPPGEKRPGWVQETMRKSDALDLPCGIFLQPRAADVAGDLKAAAEASQRRKAPPFRSAMSMLNFHLNRSGRGLPQKQRRVLERAKNALRRLFGRPTKKS